MSAKVIKKSGSTSTFIPGGTGSTGKRSAVTFYGTKNDGSSIDNPIAFNLNNNLVKIQNIYGNDITPDIGDSIVYSEQNKTYLLYIKSKEQDAFNVTISEVWDTRSTQSQSQETDISAIEINVTCVNNKRQSYRGFKANIAKRILTYDNQLETAELTGRNDPNALYIRSTCGFTFSITSLNAIPLGKYKLQIEFITDWTSPGMDTRISKKFKTPGSYSGIASFPATNEKCTLRGYVTNYSCNGTNESYTKTCQKCGSNNANIIWQNGWWVISCKDCNYTSPLPKNPDLVSENFDDEKLDNFEVTIKDYSEGVGKTSYSTTTYIPIDVLRNAYNAGYPYRCLLYLYVDGANRSKEKVFVRDMSSTFNTAAMEADTNIYGLDLNIDASIGGGDEPEIKPLPRYEGTAHYGKDKNQIEIGNVGFIIDDPNNPIHYETDPKERKFEDDVYVDQLSIQQSSGLGNWCTCTYDAVKHKLIYKAIDDNGTGETRTAYFVHSTTDKTLSYGTNAGELALPQWVVTVIQKPKGTNFEELGIYEYGYGKLSDNSDTVTTI